MFPPGAGLLMVGHGSRDPQAVHEFREVVDGIAARLPGCPVDLGFLEFARPVIREGLDALAERGVREVLAVPGMLFAAGHAKNDIPSVLNACAARSGVRIRYGRELDVDLKLLELAGRRVEQALALGRPGVARQDTLLLTVGRGASDPDANSNVAKVNRMLWEGLGLGWAETAYSGVTFPLTEPALEHCVRLGYRRVVVFPYFLFTGVLVKRIYEAADRAALRHPGVEFLKAGYLGNDPLVIEAFLERAREILEGRNLMNCQMCKYRDRVLGFEGEVGLPQESHHHHVEGIGCGPEATSVSAAPAARPRGFGVLLHAEGRHPHRHHPYPHADHPLGPRSMERER